jgi:hypothetical protein
MSSTLPRRRPRLNAAQNQEGLPSAKFRYAGTGAPSVYHVPARVIHQDILPPGVPVDVSAVPELGSQARLRRQFDLTRTAPSATAVAGSMIAGVGLIAAFLMAVFLLGAFLRGAALSGAFLIKTGIVEAGLLAGALLGAFLTRE